VSRTNRTTLGVEALEDRRVPATLNLTTRGAEGAANGALFRQLNADTLGSDPTHTFLRLQEGLIGSLLGSNEEGYNTNARPLQFDTVANGTRALTLGEVRIVTVNGVEYREFLLTVHQPALLANINLEDLQIFVGNSDRVRGYNANNNRLGGLTAVYDLDRGGNNTVRLNDNLNRSNSADLAVLIPNSVFAGAGSGSFVYLYSSFSAPVLSTGLSSAESWSVRDMVVAPPPPAGGGTASISGFVKKVAGNWNPNPDLNEGSDLGGLAGIRVYLLNADGERMLDANDQEIYTETDADGYFSFNNLNAGTYGIAQDLDEMGEGLEDGEDFASDPAVTITSDRDGDDKFEAIVLADDTAASGFYFTECNSSS
jgi:hypothetical protein